MSRPVKIVFMARRRAGIDRSELAERWLGRHAELVRHLPGLVAYRISLTQARDGAPDPAFDGIAEVTYPSREALRAAAASPEAAALAADEPNLFDMASVVRLVVDDHWILGDPLGPGWERLHD